MKISGFLDSVLENKYSSHYRRFQFDEGNRLSNHPKISIFMSEVAELVTHNRGDQVDGVIKKFISDDFDWLKEFFHQWLVDAARDNAILPALPQQVESDDGPFSVATLAGNEFLSIALITISPQQLNAYRKRRSRGTVQFTGEAAHYKCLKGKKTILESWKCDTFDDDSNFLKLKCKDSEEITILENQYLFINGREQATSFSYIEEPTIFMQINNHSSSASVSIDFDRKTGSYADAHPTNHTATRKMFLAAALRNLDFSERYKILSSMADEGPFYQRWYIAREMAAADGKKAYPLIEKLANTDASVSVRKAAKATLKLFETE